MGWWTWSGYPGSWRLYPGSNSYITEILESGKHFRFSAVCNPFIYSGRETGLGNETQKTKRLLLFLLPVILLSVAINLPRFFEVILFHAKLVWCFSMPQTDTRRDVSLYPLSLFWRWQRQEVLISYRWVIIWLRRLRSSLTMSLNWEWTPISSGEKQDINDCVSSHLIFFAVLSIAFFPLSDIMWTGFACSSPVSSPLSSWFYSMGKSSGQSGSLWFSLSSVGVCLGKPWPAKRIFASKKTLKNPKEKNKTWKYLDVFFFQIWQQCKI